MPDTDRGSVIDGFSSVQALRHSGRTPQGPRTRPSSLALPPSKNSKPKSGPRDETSRISKTIVPRRFEIVCYECDYTFVLTGHIHETLCPKCHKPLEAANIVIDSENSDTTKSIGTVEIAEKGVLKDARIVAGHVIISGDAREGSIQASRMLELCPRAQFDMNRIVAKDLLIRDGCKFNLARKIVCRNLDIQGILKAKVIATESVHIGTNGFLRGELKAGSLVIDEGGGINTKTVLGVLPNEDD